MSVEHRETEHDLLQWAHMTSASAPPTQAGGLPGYRRPCSQDWCLRQMTANARGVSQMNKSWKNVYICHSDTSVRVCVCVSFNLQHHFSVLRFNSILTASAWRQHQIPQVKGSVPQGLHLPYTSGANPKPRLSPVLLTHRR